MGSVATVMYCVGLIWTMLCGGLSRVSVSVVLYRSHTDHGLWQSRQGLSDCCIVQVPYRPWFVVV